MRDVKPFNKDMLESYMSDHLRNAHFRLNSVYRFYGESHIHLTYSLEL